MVVVVWLCVGFASSCDESGANTMTAPRPISAASASTPMMTMNGAADPDCCRTGWATGAGGRTTCCGGRATGTGGGAAMGAGAGARGGTGGRGGPGVRGGTVARGGTAPRGGGAAIGRGAGACIAGRGHPPAGQGVVGCGPGRPTGGPFTAPRGGGMRLGGPPGPGAGRGGGYCDTSNPWLAHRARCGLKPQRTSASVAVKVLHVPTSVVPIPLVPHALRVAPSPWLPQTLLSPLRTSSPKS